MSPGSEEAWPPEGMDHSAGAATVLAADPASWAARPWQRPSAGGDAAAVLELEAQAKAPSRAGLKRPRTAATRGGSLMSLHGGSSSSSSGAVGGPASLSSNNTDEGAELSPRAKEAEAAESLSSLRNLVTLRPGDVPANSLPPAPPSMSRTPSSRDAYEPAPSLRRSGSNSGPMPPIMPGLYRSTSHSGVVSTRGFPPQASDWRAMVTVEERQEVRRKIRAAYLSQTHGYDELLEVVSSVEEEYLHLCSPSRLDYIKMSVQYDKRLVEKKKQLKGEVDILKPAAAPTEPPVPPPDTGGPAVKPPSDSVSKKPVPAAPPVAAAAATGKRPEEPPEGGEEKAGGVKKGKLS